MIERRDVARASGRREGAAEGVEDEDKAHPVLRPESNRQG